MLIVNPGLSPGQSSRCPHSQSDSPRWGQVLREKLQNGSAGSSAMASFVFQAPITLLQPAAWSLPCLDPVLLLMGFFRKGEPQECVCALCDGAA